MAGAFDYFGSEPQGPAWGDEPPVAKPPRPVIDRSHFADALKDPVTRRALLANVHAEVGDQFKTNPAVAQAKLETILNRASARGMTPLQAATDPKYYPAITLQRMKQYSDQHLSPYARVYDDVIGGSNVANYATGNASGTVGFAGGPQTFKAPGTYERFGIEGADRKWAALQSGQQVAQATPQPAPQPASPAKRPPMADNESSGIGAWLGKPLQWLSQPIISDARQRAAGADGSLQGGGEDASAFIREKLAKYPQLAGLDGASGMLDVYNLQRDLLGGALKQRPVTWADAIGSALQIAGAGVTAAKGQPEIAFRMAQSPGKDFAEENSLIRRLSLQSALQNAQQLGSSLDASIKSQAESARKREELRARAQFIEGVAPPPAGVSTAPAAGSGPIPLAAPIPSVAAAPGIAVTSPRAAPPPGGTTPPPQPAASGSVQPVVPPVGAVPPPSAEVRLLREQARRAAAIGEDKTADLKLREAEAREKIEIERWKLETEAPRKGAETAASQAAKSAGDEAAKIQKARENADKLANLYQGLREKANVPGLDTIIGPFDNSWAGRWVANVNPFGPSGENAGLRSQIEGDMKAIAAIGKDITRKPGEGTWTDKDQEGLEAAIGAVLDAPNKAAYLKALEESQKRMEKLLGVELPRIKESQGGDKPEQRAPAAAPASPADLMKVPEGQTILFRGRPYVRKGTQLVPVEDPAVPRGAAPMGTMQGFGMPGQE